MMLIAAAGPAANLGTAAALVVAGTATGPPTPRLALYGAALRAVGFQAEIGRILRSLVVAPDCDGEVRQALTLQYLRSAVVDGAPVARTEAVELAGLAQAAFDRDPSATVPLALAHLLNHRAAEARALLLDARDPVAVLLRAAAQPGRARP